MSKEWRILAWMLGVFLLAYFLPISNDRVTNAIMEAFRMTQWYARNHTLACVVPAMFIAGAIATFLSKEAVLRHLGPNAHKVVAYGVASVAGTVLAVCSCSVLPMFAGIYQVGAGLGPASAFLYSGPAINVMAIFLTARVLGLDLGVARFVGSILFAIIIGIVMQLLFAREEAERSRAFANLPEPPPPKRTLWQTGLFLGTMIAFLVFSDWASPSQTVLKRVDGSEMTVAVLLETTSTLRVQLESASGEWAKGSKLDVAKTDVVSSTTSTPPGYEWAAFIHRHRWEFAAACLAGVLLMTWKWFERAEQREWMEQTWTFAKQIVPLLFGGVFVTGFVGALIPDEVVAQWVGGNSIVANFAASMIGAMWYFATLTEIPILETLLGLGMGKGPALALLLAGPALSLPSIAVIYSVFGLKKTATFVALVVVMSTAAGLLFGSFVGNQP
jgi:uncharacterized membrane protein YraQ (UPF0718 family)